jgi:hypothetical protein
LLHRHASQSATSSPLPVPSAQYVPADFYFDIPADFLANGCGFTDTHPVPTSSPLPVPSRTNTSLPTSTSTIPPTSSPTAVASPKRIPSATSSPLPAPSRTNTYLPVPLKPTFILTTASLTALDTVLSEENRQEKSKSDQKAFCIHNQCFKIPSFLQEENIHKISEFLESICLK